MRGGFDVDAIVIGAGPAGSSAATLLARAGWAVALVERQRFPRRKVCGECIAASNLPLFDALGLGAAFSAAAGPELRRVALMHGARSAAADLPAAAAGHVWGRALGRETFDALLLDGARAAGAAVLQPWSAVALEGSLGNHRVTLRTAGDAPASMTLRTPLLIDAHGSWQVLPSAPRAGSNASAVEGPTSSRAAPDAASGAERAVRRGSDLLAFKANFRDAALPDGLLPVLAFHGGYGGIVVADGGVTTLACCIRRDRLAAARRAAPGQHAGDVVEALLRQSCAGVDRALVHAKRMGPWLAAGPLAPGIRVAPGDAWFRIGNAAGEAHPIIGEGISMALQSAWLLCARLLEDERVADGRGQRAILAAYAADWRRHFAPRLRLAAACAQLAMRPAPWLRAIDFWPYLLTRAARWGGKIRCAADAATLTRLTPALASEAHAPR